MADNKTSIILTAEDRASKTIRDVGGALQNLAGSAVPAAAALASLSAGAALTGLGAIAKTAIDAADSLGDLSQRTGVAVKDLAAYKLAADQSGTSLDGVAKGMKAMATAIVDNGDALKSAGITATDTNEALRQVADLFAALPDGAQKSALATKLFGKQLGGELIPLLNLGREGLDKSAKAAEAYGSAMERLAPEADKFNDSMAQLSINLQASGAELANSFLPSLNSAITSFTLARAAGLSFFEAITGFGVRGLGESLSEATAGAGKKIQALSAELDKLRAQPPIELWDGSIDQANNERIAQVEKLLKYYKALQSTQFVGPPLELAGKAALEAARNAGKLNTAIKGVSDSAKTAKDELGDLLNKLNTKDVGLDADYAKNLGTLVSGMAAGRLNAAQYAEALFKLNSEQKVFKDATLAAAKAEDEWQKSVEKARQAAADGVIALQDRAAALEGELATYGLTKSAIEETTIARLEEQLALASGWDSQAELVANLEKEIDARKRAAAAMRGIEGRDLAKQAAEDSARAWQDFARDIEQSLTDALMRSFEAGDNFGEAFAKSLQNTFKTMVLKVAVQAVMTPVMGGLQSMLGENLGAGGTVGGASNLLSTGSNLYNIGSGGGGIYGAFAGSSFGQSLGLSSSYSVAGIGTFNEAIYADALLNGATTEAATAAATAATETALTTLGSSIPYVAAAIAIASMLSKESTPHVGGLAFGSESGYVSPDSGDAVLQYLNNSSRANSRVPLSAYNFTENDWFKRENQAVSGQLGKLSQSLAQQVNAITRQYGAGSGYSVGLAYSADGDDGSRGRFGIIRDGAILASSRQRYDEDMQQGLAEFFADIPSEILQGLRGIDLSPVVDGFLDLSMSGATDVLEGMSDATANALIGALQGGWLDEFLAQMDTAGQSFADITADIIEFSSVANLKPVFDALKLDIYSLGNALSDAFGGADALGSGLSAYYAAMYSDDERRANAMSQIEAEFARWNAQVPTSVAGWRALTEQVAASGPANAEALAALIKFGPAFAEIKAATEGVTDAADEYADAQQRVAKAQKDAIAKAVDAAYATLERSVGHELDLIAAQRDALSARVTDIAAIYDAATGGANALLGTVSSLSGQRIADARGYIDMAQALVRAGALPNQERLAGAIDALRADSIDNYASFADFEYAQLVQARKLEDIARVSGDQKSVAERQLDELDTQTDLLEAQLQAARDQVDAFNGIDTTLLSVAAAIAALEAAIAGGLSPSERSMPGYSATVGQWQAASAGNQLAAGIAAAQAWDGTDISRDQVATALASNSLASVAAAWNAQTGASVTADDVEKWAHAAGIRGFDVGINRVPRDMLALIHEDEAVIPAPFNPWAGGSLPGGQGGADNRELIQAIRDLDARLAMIERHTFATARATNGAPDQPVLVEIAA